MQRRSFATLVGLLIAALSASAQAQEERYAEEPTGGLHLPSSGLAGEQNATTVTVNPAGVGFLQGPNLVLALDLARDEGAVRSGPGGGFYYGSSLGGRLMPKIGWGLAVEWLRPPRAELTPDPGTPTRLTQSLSLPMGRSSHLGLSWHHFFDEIGTLDGLDSFDLGWSARFGARWAAGFVLRDMNAPSVDGESIQRRYEFELVSRPLETDRLELGLGSRIGEKRVDFKTGEDVDGWLWWSVKLLRGLYFRGQLDSTSLRKLTTDGDLISEGNLRDYRLSAGLQISFGGLGTSFYGTGVVNEDGDAEATGGTLMARLSPVRIPSIMPTGKRIERLELKGGIGQQRLTYYAAQLRRLAEDEDVVGLFLHIDGAAAGWATLHELRDEIVRFRKSGKKVFAFMVAGSTRQYFLASAADRIYVDPAGGIRLTGFAGQSLYFKGLFDKLGVTAEFERIEEYKSAPESWTRSGPTEPAFRMRNELYDSMYQTIVADIAASRKISETRVRTLIDNGPYTAGELEKLTDLVDGVVSTDDLAKTIAKDMGRFYAFGSKGPERSERWHNDKVAVIYLVGDIVGGKSRTIPLLGRQLVGGDTIARAIAQARADRDVKAIVLRINSPGGSALASEIMAREVKKTRGVKPIICSMGDMAASGGYFAAAYCDRIFADEMTITGSIGIFNGKFDISGLLSRMGLSWTTYKRGERADLESMFKPLTPEERKLMKSKLFYYYDRFVSAVSEGRGMDKKAVDDVGRGHVWTGTQSTGIALVDELGGIIDAIDYAKQMAGFEKGEKAGLIMLPKSKPSLLSQVLGGGIGMAKGAEADEGLDAARAFMGLLPGDMGQKLIDAIPGSLWAEPNEAQARLPFAIVTE